MLEPFIPEYGGASELHCAPLTPAQLAACDAAWPEYGSHPIMSRDQARNMAEGAFFHGELETPVPACLGESSPIRFDLMADIRAKLAVAGQTALASRYGLHMCAPNDLAQFMAECRAFLAELGARNEF